MVLRSGLISKSLYKGLVVNSFFASSISVVSDLIVGSSSVSCFNVTGGLSRRGTSSIERIESILSIFSKRLALSFVRALSDLSENKSAFGL